MASRPESKNCGYGQSCHTSQKPTKVAQELATALGKSTNDTEIPTVKTDEMLVYRTEKKLIDADNSRRTGGEGGGGSSPD